MKITQRKGLRTIEDKANAFLARTPFAERPELPDRSRAVSVAYSTNGYFEVTGISGALAYWPVEEVKKWL